MNAPVKPKGWAAVTGAAALEDLDPAKLTDAKLPSSGILNETAIRAGIGYADHLSDAAEFGLGHCQPDVARAPIMLIPYYDVDGQPLIVNGIPFYRARLLVEVPERGSDGRPVLGRNGKPKLVRYLQPAKSGCQLYLPPLLDWRAVAADASVEILIAEGELKALAACQAGYACLGLGGVANWSERDQQGTKRLLKALSEVI